MLHSKNKKILWSHTEELCQKEEAGQSQRFASPCCRTLILKLFRPPLRNILEKYSVSHFLVYILTKSAISQRLLGLSLTQWSPLTNVGTSTLEAAFHFALSSATSSFKFSIFIPIFVLMQSICRMRGCSLGPAPGTSRFKTVRTTLLFSSKMALNFVMYWCVTQPLSLKFELFSGLVKSVYYQCSTI